jgi:FkbM family methyltransferase
LLQRALSSLSYRAKWARLGVVYGRSLKLNQVRIGGRRIDLSFPAAEQSVQEHEFGKIVFDDCYQLARVHAAKTVLDIGANIGLFALAARRAFPTATIHCYEPNPAIIPHLQSHTDQIGAVCTSEAVGLSDGTISLQTSGDGSLFSVARHDVGGKINQRSFSSAVALLGTVDLLKLDCEGAEWEIFEDLESWKSVTHLTMEYHLWAKEGTTVASLRATLASLGFTEIDIQPSDDDRWGMAFAAKAG